MYPFYKVLDSVKLLYTHTIYMQSSMDNFHSQMIYCVCVKAKAKGRSMYELKHMAITNDL
jgi:hypothetical protein